MARKLNRSLPGDRSSDSINSMIRVDHAGEYGAKRIYEGQLSVLGDDPVISRMADQERAHLDFFNKEIVARRTRPTALHPLWHVAGYALGVVTAKMGRPAAMACTVAVETVIAEHYDGQLKALKNNPKEKKLRAAIKKFKAEEEEHHEIGLSNAAEQAAGYALLTRLIKSGTRLAIAVAKKI